MQVNSLHLIILATACLMTIEGIPTGGLGGFDLSKIQVSRLPWDFFNKFKLCGGVETECHNPTDCCPSLWCGYPNGYSDGLTRCCQLSGKTGCTYIAGTNGKGCCTGYYCSYVDSTQKQTVCRSIIHKK